jgi:demethylmenaquinone methyltransferase/2-methoxy-6-polyprenyl-1,4-benzoquinol methylase
MTEVGRDLYDPEFVRGVFDRCSERYIALSWLFSFGFTERWRRQCVERLPVPAAPAPSGYDLMAGTGEVWPHLLRRFPHIASIVAIDISDGMHEHAMQRLHAHRAHRITFLRDDVLQSRLPDASADFVISTFGLKTFNAWQHRQLSELVGRVLKPGGTFAMIEASDPKGWWLRPLYRLHLTKILPLVERILLRGAQDFAMIGTYTENFGNAEAIADMLSDQGLEVGFQSLFFGCATMVHGRKPAI